MYFQDLQVTGGTDLLQREDGQLTYLCNGRPVESGKPMESQRASENKEHAHIHTRIILQRLETKERLEKDICNDVEDTLSAFLLI